MQSPYTSFSSRTLYYNNNPENICGFSDQEGSTHFLDKNMQKERKRGLTPEKERVMNTLITSPTIIDVEASGFGSKSYPIEIGVITSDGRRFCRLIRPLSHWTHWDYEAERLHGITQRDLEKHGESPTRVCHQLNAFLQKATAYSDGWTVDSSWINRLFGDVGVNMLFRVSPLELILSEDQMSIWHSVKDSMLKRVDLKRHRASNDAKVVQSTYNKTLEMLALGEVAFG